METLARLADQYHAEVTEEGDVWAPISFRSGFELEYKLVLQEHIDKKKKLSRETFYRYHFKGDRNTII